MANVIKHKRGSGSDPAANNLVLGELAIRTDTGKLFTKMDSGAIAEIAGGGSDIAINTLSASSGSGGNNSGVFDNSATRFTLSSPPNVSAAQLLVSVNGVIQKPVPGTGTPSEGFSVDGNDIIFSSPPETGADFFILTFRSLGVSEPADNSVTSAKIVDGAIVNADINASAAISKSKIETFVNNNADDRLITGSGTANTLNGESALTFNGTQLRFGATNTQVELQTSDGSDNGFLNLSGGGACSQARGAQVVMYGNEASSNEGTLYLLAGQSASTNSKIKFFTSGVQKAVIDSSGRVNIGDTQMSSNLLNIEDGTAAAIDIASHGSGGDTAYIGVKKSTGGGLTLGISNRDIIFKTGATYNNGTTFDSGSERMRIRSDGLVGVGTTDFTTVGSPNKNFVVGSTTNAQEVATTLNVMEGTNNRRVKFFLDDDDGVFGIDSTASTGVAPFVIRMAQSEKLRMDQSGNIGIGIASPQRLLHQHLSSSSANYHQFTNSTTGSGGGNGGIVGIDANEDLILWNQENKNVRFGTNNTERVRIDNSGVAQMAVGSSVLFSRNTGGTNTTAVLFKTAGSQVGKIFFNNSDTFYSTGSSDRTVKKNFENWTESVLPLFKNLTPQKFHFIQEEDSETKHKGFIAQDEVASFPEAYPKDPDTDKYLYSPNNMVVYLMKAVQELTAKVEALEAK